jgi:hypothetical protein
MLQYLTLDGICTLTRLAGHLKQDILPPQSIPQSNPNVPPLHLPRPILTFLASSLGIPLDAMLEIWDAGYKLGVTTDTDMDFFNCCICIWSFIFIFLVARLCIYLKYPVVHFVSLFISTDTPVCCIIFNRNEQYLWHCQLAHLEAIGSHQTGVSEDASSAHRKSPVRCIGSLYPRSIGSHQFGAVIRKSLVQRIFVFVA